MRIDPQLSHVPYISEYAGVWAIREREGLALARAAEHLNLQVHLQQVNIGGEAEAAADTRFKTAPASRFGDFLLSPEGVAIIELSGALTKQRSSFSAGTSTIQARRQLRKAVASNEVNSIVLLIDSPGGSAKGTADLADEVRRAGMEKRTVAFVEDLAASAAYFVASQADEVVANQPEAIVGSLGTLLVVYDLSKQAEQEGITVHVISTGPFKGMGAPGSEITEEQLAELQREVEFINGSFLRAVRAGRDFSAKRIKQLFTGQVWPASEALELGLVDRIETFDDLLGRLARENAPPESTRVSRQLHTPEQTSMADSTNQPTTITAPPATIDEIRRQCRGCDEAFIVGQLEKQATLTACMTAWAERQQARIAELEAEKEQAAEDARRAEQKARDRVGTQSLADEARDGDFSAYEGGATGEMLRRRDELMAVRKWGMGRAMSHLARTDPALLEAARDEQTALRRARSS